MKNTLLVTMLATLALALAGCASNGPEWHRGAPDAVTHAHYEQALKAIAAQSKPDAKAAIALMQDDASRVRTEMLNEEALQAQLAGASSAVERGDWDAARKTLLNIQAQFGKP